jgi:hypothetical protein
LVFGDFELVDLIRTKVNQVAEVGCVPDSVATGTKDLTLHIHGQWSECQALVTMNMEEDSASILFSDPLELVFDLVHD